MVLRETPAPGLATGDVERYLRAAFDGGSPAGLTETVRAHTEGNPFIMAEAHARELVEHLTQAGPACSAGELIRYLATLAYEEAKDRCSRTLELPRDRATDSEMADQLFGLGRAQLALDDPGAAASLWPPGGRMRRWRSPPMRQAVRSVSACLVREISFLF